MIVYVVTDLQQQWEIVRDEDHREAQARLQGLDLIEDLALHHHIQSRGGLVHDDQLGVERQRDGNDRALAHATTELVRKTAQSIRRDADQAYQLYRSLTPLASAHGRIVGAKRVSDLRLDVQDRIERIHRALKDDRQLSPTKPAQFLRQQLHNIDTVANTLTRHPDLLDRVES